MENKIYRPILCMARIALLMFLLVGTNFSMTLSASAPAVPGTAIAAPTALAATNVTSTSFRANWQSVNGAEYYKLYVYRLAGLMPTGQPLYMIVSGYDGRQVQGTNNTVAGLSAGLQYKYHVVAVGIQYEESDPSGTIFVTTSPAAPAATAATNITHNSFTANWNSVSGATSYKLYVEMKFLGLVWSSVSGYEDGKVVSGTSHNVSQLMHMTEHRYWLKAVNANGESGNSNTIDLQTKLTPTTTNAAYNISSTSFTANWNESVGATSYLLYVVRNSDEKNIINGLEVEGTLHTVTGLSPGTGYHFSVRAKRDAQTSVLSNWTLVTTAPDTPAAKAATNISSTSFQANWDAAAGATAYKLSVWKKNGSVWVPGYNEKIVTGTSEVITGLDPLTEYKYRLRAVASSSESGYSATIDVTTAPAPPVALPATNITSTSFKANWQAYTAATHYDLYVYSKRTLIAITWKVVEGYDGVAVNGLEKIVTGLSPNTHYKYFIRAKQGSTGESEPSNEVFVNTLNAYTLSLSSMPSGAGTLSGGGTFNEGATVTANATANAGYTFVNWTENGTVVSTSNSYVFQITSDRTLVANFIQQSAQTYTVTVTPSHANRGTVSGGGTFTEGSNVTVIATPSSKIYQFANWTENGKIVSTDASYSFELTANRNLVANFEAQQITNYTVALTASPAGAGVLTGDGTYATGTSVTVMATPAAGFNFVNWTEGGTAVSSAASYTFTISANRNLVANFEQKPDSIFTLALTAAPVGAGTLTGAGTFASGASVTINASPAAGYNFQNWKEGGTVVSTSASYTFNITANRNLVANFELKNYTVQASHTPAVGGSISFTSQTFAHGTNATIVATPATGYKFVNWKQGNNVVSQTESYTFSVLNNINLQATFELKTSADQVSSLVMKAYPNPANSLLNLSGVPMGYRVTISSITGHKIMQAVGNGEVMQIDVNAMPKGVYLINAQGEQGSYILRFVKN